MSDFDLNNAKHIAAIMSDEINDLVQPSSHDKSLVLLADEIERLEQDNRDFVDAGRRFRGEIIKLEQELEEAKSDYELLKESHSVTLKGVLKVNIEMLADLEALRNTPSAREAVLRAVDIYQSKAAIHIDIIDGGIYLSKKDLIEYAETLDK